MQAIVIEAHQHLKDPMRRGKRDRARHAHPAPDQRNDIHEGDPQTNYRMHRLSRGSAHPVRLEINRLRRDGGQFRCARWSQIDLIFPFFRGKMPICAK